MGKLTAAKIKSIAKPGMYGDGGTLYLSIAPGGSKSWIQRLTIDGKRRDLGLGAFPLVTLVEAREKAFDNRKLARAGGDPLAQRRKANVPIFQEAAQRTIDANRAQWRNAKTAANWAGSLAKYAYPVFGDQRVDKIGREEVLRVLIPLWQTKPAVARKLRQRIRAVLAWAQAHGHVDANPAGEAINAALPAMPSVKAHFRALPYREVKAALETVEASKASISAKLCLRFLIFNAVRSSEARGACWSEIDPDAQEWRIPARRTKTGVEHRVPISDAAKAVLQCAKSIADGSDLVFPSPIRAGKQMSDMTLTKILRSTGLADRATVHGFRSSFRDWCAETGKPREIAEAALAHIVGGVEGAYFRSDLFQRRRVLMEQWAAFLAGEHADVVQLHG